MDRAVPVLPLDASMFSAVLFPQSVLADVGGFDIALGDAYRARFLFRLIAEGVTTAFIGANGSSTYAVPPSSSAAQTDIAALANLI